MSMLQLPKATTTPKKMSGIARISARLDAAIQKASDADTHDADIGRNTAAAPLQRAAYALWSRLDKQRDKLVEVVLASPAHSIDDMLLKIRAAGVYVNRGDVGGDAANPLVNLDDWEDQLTGYLHNDAPARLLCSLREDLRRIQQGAR